ncbi:MAG: D-alanyl-D-alanine endopeptidase, partial [Paraburkholderia sp.]|nr:D-alanyl-D-alanine endopeptidase [Paraburkholderia sp.]
MKTDMFSSLKVIHGAALSTALSVAASLVITASFAAPVEAFAAAPDAPAKPAKATRSTKKSAARAAKADKAAEAKADANSDDTPRTVVKKKRVSYTMNGRHHLAMRRVAFEPRQPSVGQAFGLHETPDALMLRSSVAYVVDQNSSEPLFDKNSHAVVPIASITKLMTAMVVLDSKAPMTEQIEVTDEDRDYEKNTGSRLSVGSVLSREDMLHIAL